MKIGVLDTDGTFENPFFNNKKLSIIRKEVWTKEQLEKGALFTHSEYVCAYIFKENPDAEVLLVTIINSKLKCSVQALIDGLEYLMQENVDIINLSIGDEYRNHKELEQVCKRAYDSGILIIAAHSNSNVEATYPAIFPFVLSVRCVDSAERTDILTYNEGMNELCFSSSYFSIYHLGVPKLIPGNSFANAKITGLLSHYKQDYKKFLDFFEKSPLNQHYPYSKLKSKKSLFLSNRLGDSLEERFINEVTTTVFCAEFIEEVGNLDRNHPNISPWDILFIDCNSFVEIEPYKQTILQLLEGLPDKEIILRYPLFSLYERIGQHISQHKCIQQLFI
ncbi:S8 family serine peptidase [Anaerocolumna xylanovorans]|uniref:Subtilase family protein n=1 Tax=Anaerocolumna xylanovorans DSM 12503 TaxID=1121345 RepID=A0A1M7Y8Z3_9FIRM|nr:S8 family serine peptidase [Anaerocolumna xylanovorans]SHO49103.1 Subtilase family protein [Anaerocolumna xylanovorans DSM 12503]